MYIVHHAKCFERPPVENDKNNLCSVSLLRNCPGGDWCYRIKRGNIIRTGYHRHMGEISVIVSREEI